jgi:large subunit ribosomal protein L3
MTATRNVKGLLGTKLGMTQVWDENNKLIPVTVVQADSNVITQLRNAEADGYVAVQIGYGQIDPRKVTKPLAGHFERQASRLAATSSNSVPQMLLSTSWARSSP